MNCVAIVDTETSGTDHAKARVVEVGVILYSLDHYVDVASFSSLIRCDGQPAEAEKINRIPSTVLPHGAESDVVWNQVRTFIANSKAVLAHSAGFDRDFFPEDLRSAKPWICTNDDIEWPAHSGSRALIAIALAHGLGVAKAHRALTDCELISRLLTRCHEMGHDVKAMLRRGLRPKARFQALVSFDDKQLAKDAGFRWLEDRDKKMKWMRTMAIEDVDRLPFKVRPLDTGTDLKPGAGPLFDPLLVEWNQGAP